MGAKKPLKYRDLRKILKRYGVLEDKSRAKGSERMFYGIVAGIIVRFPTKCHGEGDLKPIPVINAIRRAFRLTEIDGVSDDEFYGRG
jgi:hypothetical protein